MLHLLLLLSVNAFALEPITKENVKIINEGGSWVSEWVNFDLPAGAKNMYILATGPANSLLAVTDLIDPSGFAFVSSTSNGRKITQHTQPILRNVKSPNRSEAVSLGTATLVVPNSPKLPPLKSGTWKIRFLTRDKPENEKVNFTIYPRNSNGNTLEARVWISPNSYWEKNKVQKIAEGAQKIYSELGIQLKFLSFELLEKDYDHPLVLPNEISSLAWKQNDPEAVNIYFMPTMEFQTKPVNGLACLGGPANINTPHSCFVSMYASPAADEISMEEKSKILAHEIGHYLGLFHTKDEGIFMIGTMNDPFEDTEPEPTGKNLMDPGAHVYDAKLSNQQREMILASPALK